MSAGKPRLLVLSLGGTITMLPDPGGGIAPKLGAAELVASVPALADAAEIEAHSPFRLPSPSLEPAQLVAVARRIEAGFAEGRFDGAVVIQGTDTIEESAFLLDLLVGGDRPVVVTGAMRGADAPGADGPANLLAAVRVAASPAARGLGTLAVLNYEIHAARFVQKAHTALPSAFASPQLGPIGTVAEGRPRFWARLARLPCHPAAEGPPRPVALLRWAMGEDGRLLAALPDLGYAGAVIEGMGAGHVPAGAVPRVAALAAAMPVVLASRCPAGPVFTETYGYPGSERDLLARGLIPAGHLSGLQARLLLGLALRAGGDEAAHAAAAAAFAPYQ
jgi:L-asparaginase